MKKQKSRKILAMSVIAFMLTTACKKEKEVAPIPEQPATITNVFAFVKPGNRSVFSVNGMHNGFPYNYANGFILEVASEKEKNKFAINFMFDFSPYYKDTLHTTWQTNTEELLSMDASAISKVVTKSNPTVGSVTYSISGTDTIYRKIINAEMEVTVPAGKFTCAKIKEYYSNKAEYMEEYYSLKDGLIKRDLLNSANPYVSELVSKNF